MPCVSSVALLVRATRCVRGLASRSESWCGSASTLQDRTWTPVASEAAPSPSHSSSFLGFAAKEGDAEPSWTWTPATSYGCPPPRPPSGLNRRKKSPSRMTSQTWTPAASYGLPMASASSSSPRIKGASRTPGRASSPASSSGTAPPPPADPPPPSPSEEEEQGEWMRSAARSEAIRGNERAIFRNFTAFMALSAVLLFACDWKIRRDEKQEQEAFAAAAEAWARCGAGDEGAAGGGGEA
mmetsp:Transcript_27370/g.88397  ORF Transcript_27370/g.88397 Transcript_27370/m.88397 type:complete len:240 (+) Transcript_27370:47-766(+)